MRDKSLFNAGLRQAFRAAPPQRLNRNPQDGLEKINCRLTPKRLRQTLAETNPRGCSMPHRRRDESCTAKLDKATMAHPVKRGPVQNADSIRIRNEFAQDFSRLVPVDQEDERGAKLLEKAITRIGIVKGKTAGDEIKGFFVMQFRCVCMRKPIPLNWKIAQEIGEELGAGVVNVRISDSHSVGFLADHNDMGIGFRRYRSGS